MITINEKFIASIIADDMLIPSNWYVSVNILPLGHDQQNFQKGVERISVYLTQVLDSSILCSYKSALEMAENFNLSSSFHFFPDDPADHLIAICLFTKLTSLVQNVFSVESITVESDLTPGITHGFDGDTMVLQNLYYENTVDKYVQYWYNPRLEYFEASNHSLKLITEDWETYDLDFDFPTPPSVELSSMHLKKKLRKYPKPKDGDNDDG